MKKMRIAITGAQGFIGSHLMRVLGTDFDVFTWDLRDKHDIMELEDLMSMDVVVHLAALTDVQESRQQAERYFWTNAIGTAHILELAVKARCRMIYISSAAAAEPDSSPYAYSKWMGEQMVEQMMHAVRGVILRPQNVYGKGMHANALFARFLTNNELVINGDGSHRRDFINVTDVAFIIRHAIEKNWQHVKLDVGTGIGTSILDIAKLFAKYSGKKIVHAPAVPEIATAHAKVKKLTELYPLKFVTNLETDIAAMVAENN